MRVIYADEKLCLNNTVVILGNFDGVHIAHQSLIKEAVKIAEKKSLSSVVYTFSEHPQKKLFGDIKTITLNSEKEKIFSDLGVDVLVYQHPTKDFLNIPPEDFISDILVKSLGTKVIVVGEHYSFGCNASGNSNLLKTFSSKFGIVTHIMPLIFNDGELVSSSNIRKHIVSGEITRANKLLGREFCISGKIEHGNQMGNKMGFPTANISLMTEKVIPKYGVYACSVLIENTRYQGIANIGVKPTFDGEIPLIEVHLFNTNENFYEKNATVNLYEFIREEIKFSDIYSLKNQIEIDVKSVKEYFSYNLK
ncbi:MAG: bifunctional riboflavin kinase/FAD synthetase [Clostridia bacterium]|nr:bifunctional riboflavin kinase/FAD synthetase [Clostridia bacterium]